MNATLDEATLQRMIKTQIKGLSCQRVGKRPNRYEPRAVKRRPKPMKLLTMPREKARESLRQGIDPYRMVK